MAHPGIRLVDRDAELALLRQHLDRAVAGDGHVCFVRGEGGAGKTTLLTAFTGDAQRSHPELLVATGACDSQTGIGDAFLPFREILELLTGDVDTKVAQGRISEENAGRIRRAVAFCTEALVEIGPDLIGAVVPGAGLLASVGMFVASKTPWADKLQRRVAESDRGRETIDQDQIFEQYTRVLEALSRRSPLLLVVDDLQWADTASVALLFRLGRRLAGSRVLLVGLYRPSDVALGRGGERHPLDPVVNELKRYHGDIEVDVGPEDADRGRRFVDAYLDAEQNRLDAHFRDALFQQTGGHALFTVELLRALQERGALHRDEAGIWTADPALDWSDTPRRVEGVIEERLSRLSEEQQRTLTIAAVEGETFSGEVVAAVQPAEVRELVARLSDTIAKRHRLVQALGVQRLPGGRLSRYRFAHSTMQHYLVHRLDDVESAYLHEDVARALEQLYAGSTDAVVVQLAHLYHAAGAAAEACRYAEMAGDLAMRTYAATEALEHYTRALGWAEQDEDRFRLRVLRLAVHDLTGDTAARRADVDGLDEIAARTGDPGQLAQAAAQRAALGIESGDYAEAARAARAAIEAFTALADPASATEARLHLASASFRVGDYVTAREVLEQAADDARSLQRVDLLSRSISTRGIVADLSGDRAGARAAFEEALALAQEAGRESSEANAWSNLGVSYWRTGDLDGAVRCFRHAVAIQQRVGARSGTGTTLANLAMASASQGDLAAARGYAEEALVVNREMDVPYNVARTLGILASILAAEGRYGAARTADSEALAIDRRVGDRQDEACRLANLGLYATALGHLERGDELLGDALRLARELGDRDIEAMTLRHRAVLELTSGRAREAIAVVTDALALTTELQDEAGETVARVVQGWAALEQGDTAAAGSAFARAAELGGERRGTSSAVGLAAVAQAEGDLVRAMALAEPALPGMLAGTSPVGEDGVRPYLVAGRLLAAAGDPRAEAVLAAGRALLDRTLADLDDTGERSGFLAVDAVTRELAASGPPTADLLRPDPV